MGNKVPLSLRHRLLEPEVMDDPALETPKLHAALSGLQRINSISNSARIVWRPIASLARSQDSSRLRILDIATGAGDVPVALWRRAKRSGLELEVHGIDFSPRSVDFARQVAAEAKAKVTFECRNVLADDLPAGFDVIMCSLFLHHLTTADAVQLLARMAAAARQMVLVSDLRRCYYGLTLAYAASRLLSRCDVVHEDAVQSVRAAFTPRELTAMAEEARLPRATIVSRWPARMLLECRTAKPA
jgi:2-polyprenyl-3-methyl-5-hydroxy-6-metoxy-1,4-benzoquinol methylase